MRSEGRWVHGSDADVTAIGGPTSTHPSPSQPHLIASNLSVHIREYEPPTSDAVPELTLITDVNRKTPSSRAFRDGAGHG